MQTADLIIRGGTVADGTGRSAYRGDVAVQDGKIAAVGDLGGLKAKRECRADGLIVAPGFIDAHAHSDTAFVNDTSGASKLFQGITTEISGNCGESPFPAAEGTGPWQFASFADFREAFSAQNCRMAVNQAMLVGHGTLRQTVIGSGAGAASEAEIAKMQRLLARDLEDGAFGLSLGLEYAPGCFANQQELNALGKTAAETGAVVTCHLRSEGEGIFSALEELKEIGRVSGAHVHASHLKLDCAAMHGKAAEVYAEIEKANREGICFTADMYPYTASSTTLSIRCPRWSLDGGREALLSHLRGARRAEILEALRSRYSTAEQAETCLFCDDGGGFPGIVGLTLRDAAENLLHTHDYAQAAAEILLRTQAKAWCVFFVMSEKDVMDFLARDICIGSDGYALPGDETLLREKPHPRSYGAVAKFLQLCREKKLCSLEEAVHRVSGKPAGVFSLPDRGLLKAGYAADITVFDASKISAPASYAQPVQLAKGVEYVFSGGEAAIWQGVQTDARPGQFLRRRIPARKRKA